MEKMRAAMASAKTQMDVKARTVSYGPHVEQRLRIALPTAGGLREKVASSPPTRKFGDTK
jgi:hypothetical protein